MKTLECLDEVEEVFVWDEDDAALEAFKTEGKKIGGIYTDLDRLLEHDDVRVVVVTLPNSRAPAVTIRAIEAGKHIMAEKPMAANAADLVRIVEAGERCGVVVSVCYPWRAHPAPRQIRGWITDGVFGRIVATEARMITSHVRFRNPAHWLFRKEIAGGGIVSWLGCHFLDLLRFMLRDEVEAVSAIVATLSGEAIEVEDTASLALRFRNGALGTFQLGYMLPISRAGYVGASYDTYLGIRGDSGNVSWEPSAREEAVLRVESVAPEWLSAPRREFRYTMATSEAYGGTYGEQFMRQFLRAALAGDTEPPTTGEDALAVMRIVEAAYESSATGKMMLLRR
jgi:predicted dehydrogenase